MKFNVEYRDQKGGASQWSAVRERKIVANNVKIKDGNLIFYDSDGGVKLILNQIHWLSCEIEDGYLSSI